MSGTGGEQRISISLAQLQAELGKLELRLVDRLNGALANKADRVVQEQHSERINELAGRLQIMEKSVVYREGPVAQMVEANHKRLNDLSSVAKYKRWLWVQTAALAGIAVPAILFLIDHWVSP
jgi:GTPase involved in cell partitioning and DNA repair